MCLEYVVDVLYSLNILFTECAVAYVLCVLLRNEFLCCEWLKDITLRQALMGNNGDVFNYNYK